MLELMIKHSGVSITGAAMNNHQQVMSGGQKMLISTKEFSYNPFDPVSLHR